MTPIATVADFDEAFSRMVEERVDGFLVVGSPLTDLHRASLANLELKHLLPGIFSNKANVQAGGLMSYSADLLYMYRHAAIYLDKIIKGEKPAACSASAGLSDVTVDNPDHDESHYNEYPIGNLNTRY